MMPKWLLAIRGTPPRTAALALGLVPLVVLLVLWWLLTYGPVEQRVISSTILPSPVEVARAILGRHHEPPDPPDPSDVSGLLTERDLPHHLLVSLRRVGLGYLLAVLVAVPAGILMGAFGSVRAMFTPVVTASGYIPIATLVPLTMSWFGTDEKQKVMFLALAFAIFLLPQVIGAIDQVPDVYVRTAATLGASRLQVVLRVLLPVALPGIWHGMRLAFGVGWTYLVLTEVVVLTDGLGYLVAQSQRRGPREHIYLVIAVITLVAWCADILWARLGAWLFPYQQRNT